MDMKKMTHLLFAGAAMIGLGIGVFLLELQSWQVCESRTDLMDKPLQTTYYERTVVMAETDKLQVERPYYHTGYPVDYETEVVYDESCTETTTIRVDYRGHAPRVYQSAYYEEPDGTSVHTMWVDTSNYADGMALFDLIEAMFDNQIFYIHNETCYIEKITVFTSEPDKVTII